MLKGLATILLMTGCLLGASALPTRASSFGSALRRRDSSHQSARNPPLDDLALSVVDIDQSAEASSNVDDFVPHGRNRLEFGKYQHRYSDLYKLRSGNGYPLIVKDTLEDIKKNKDCVNCASDEQGIVTLGESRSYSVVTGSQTSPFPRDKPVTEMESLTTVQDTFTTSWVTAQSEESVEEASTEPVETIQGEIISVRVSSSVGKSVHQEPAALQIEERPFATAVQRSHFSVEEAVHEPLSTSADVQTRSFESSKFVTNAGEHSPTTSTALPLILSSATSSTIGRYPTPSNDRSDRSLYFRKSQFSEPLTNRQDSPMEARTGSLPQSQAENSQIVVLSENTSPPVNPLSSPVNYHTSLQSATSGSRVSFYREPPNFRRPQSTSPSEMTSTSPSSLVEPNTQRLKHETRVETVSFHEEVVLPQRAKEIIENETDPNVNEQKSYQFTNVHDRSFHHVQVTHLNEKKRLMPYTSSGKVYQQAEKVYGTPEQNYEVDEALSVRSNGRAHGVQGGPAASRPDNNKFGYVVEGRDFKKYRVEERTADGFIVGEYGVVRHDDGSTRGVRYTADSNINPKVIYEALVKFLSL